ncbi:flagellar filament capping protein FliD [Lysinibacillus sp. Bpr_S20]|uniref:flagellar filament capping protein FliD n=1 Tax=Lysinibacillus sp. Bpr_S20 TaxID=2933964 RepID=UPI002010F0DF|nr:flagellar filament capping protein FliD [Lysinibacillus sp. Bpr_S20]MCL1699941.1 flagellar filament capping protein FliD [Lysinibacillus sp. Bpr_S20]
MVMRIGGLASGMDIDELVKKLMSAERAPLNKLFQSKQRYEWQRDAYRDVNKKLKTFDTYIADNLVLKSITSKTASSSNSNLVSAVATGKATGTVSIEGVSQLAEAGRITSGQVSANGTTKMKEIASGTIEFRAVQADGTMAKETTKIEISDDMTVNDFVKKVNESGAGVSAVFESGRFSFTAKNTGKGSVEITGDTSGLKLTEAEGASIREGKNAIFQVNGIATERSSNTFSINGYNITLKSTFNGEQATTERYNSAYEEWINTTSSEYNQKIDDALAAIKTATDEYDVAKADFDDAKNAFLGTVELSKADKTAFNKIGNPQFARNLTEAEVQTIADKSFENKEEFNAWLNDDSSDAELKAKLKGANINFAQFKAIGSLDYEKLQSLSAQSMYNTLGATFLGGLTDEEKALVKDLPTSKEDFNNQIADWKKNGTEEQKALAEKLSKLNNTQKDTLRQLSDDDFDTMTGLAEAQLDHNLKLEAKNTAEKEHTALVNRQTKAEADFKDAYKQQFKEEYTDDKGDPGKVKDIPEASESPVRLTSTTNVDEMMDKIKDFVKTYNGLILDFKDQTTQTKYRDYAPLTSEQREGMSENEIKLWEEKAKSGLLRSDELIRGGLSNMRSLVYEANPGLEGSKYNTLFNIGITTSKNYNEGGTLAIDEDKLRKALEEDPDAVERLFNNVDGKKDAVIDGKTVDTRGYLRKLRDTMKDLEVSIEKKAGRATMSASQYTIGKNLMDTEKRISTWQDKLKNIEARYWKQFGAMEQAINKANQQSSMFMQG